MTRVFANDRLRLAVVDVCNYRCWYCTNEGQPKDVRSFLPVEFAQRLAAAVVKEGLWIRKLNVTGGEPTLHSGLCDIVRTLAPVAECVTLNTNGHLLDRSLIRGLRDAGLHNIKFGVDCFGPLRTKPGAPPRLPQSEAILDLVRYAAELMPRSSVNVVVTPFNASTIGHTIDLLDEYAIDRAEFLETIPPPFPATSAVEVGMLSIADVVRRHAGQFAMIQYNPKLAKFVCWTRAGIMMQFAEDFCRRRVCGNLWTRVDARGRLVPCLRANEAEAIRFDRPLAAQIEACNATMCNGPGGSVPRDIHGATLAPGCRGAYIRPAFSLVGLEETDVDP